MRTWHNLAALAVLVAIAIVTWVLVLMVLAVPAFSAQAVVTKGLRSLPPGGSPAWQLLVNRRWFSALAPTRTGCHG
jgi:hypothetical protein